MVHSSKYDGLFFEVMQGDHTYYKTKITHPVAVQLGNFAISQLSRLSARSNQCTLPARYQNSDNDSAILSDPNLCADDESALATPIVTGKHTKPGKPKKDDTIQHEKESRMQNKKTKNKTKTIAPNNMPL
eukprot:11750781-Ditylum_brightwellii.AAC.1